MSEAAATLSLRQLIRADFDHAVRQAESFRRPSRSVWRRVGMALEPALACVVLHRLAHAAWLAGARRVAAGLATLNRLLLRAVIDPAAEIGPGLYIPHPSAVFFAGSAGRDLVIFANAIVAPERATSRVVGASARGPRLGDDVVIGFNALVLGDIDVGNGARIGGAAVVTRSVPPGAVCRSPFRGRAG
jgi:serine O-acetyltransferase